MLHLFKIPDFKKLIALMLVWRVVLFVIVGVAAELMPVRDFMQYAVLESVLHEERSGLASSARQTLLYPWASFDGIHYLQIAGEGYSDQGRFLPLYPFLLSLPGLLMRLVGWHLPPFHWLTIIWALVLNFVLLLGGLWQLFCLIQKEYAKSIAWKTVLALLLSPTAFFFAGIYSESLFLLILTSMVVALNKRKWGWSFMAVSLASVTRLPGFLLGIVCLFSIWKDGFLEWTRKKQLRWISMSIISAVPLLFYSFYNYMRWGDFLYFISAHAQLSNSRSVTQLVFPLQTLYRYITILLTLPPNIHEYWLASLEAVVFVGSLFLMWLGYKMKLRSEYVLLVLLLLALPAFSGTFSGLPRYVLPIFPVFLILAKAMPKRVFIGWTALSFIFQLLLAVLFSRGYLIG